MKAFPSAFTAPRTQLPIVSKYRRKIGIDVAVEALTEALRQKRSAIDVVHRLSKMCRGNRVLLRYLEAII